jgi:hypothetical protein
VSASDKLRNLQGAASKERTQEELFAAFPQLLAVVETAEALDKPDPRRPYRKQAELHVALLALDEALGE